MLWLVCVSISNLIAVSAIDVQRIRIPSPSSPDSQDEPYEVKRAREINRVFGPRGSLNAYDVILDLHNTTSNMGNCLIISEIHRHLELHACRYIQVNAHLAH